MDQRVVMKMIVAALQNRDIPSTAAASSCGRSLGGDIVDAGAADGRPPTRRPRVTINFGSNHEGSDPRAAEIIALTGSRSQIVHRP